jgi:ketol-acid reductoisomerase
MARILGEIQNGEFAREFIQENLAGQATLKAKRRIGREHQIEEVGSRLRDMMPWIKANKIVDKSRNRAGPETGRPGPPHLFAPTER